MGEGETNRLGSMKKQSYITFPQGKTSWYPNGSGLGWSWLRGTCKTMRRWYCRRLLSHGKKNGNLTYGQPNLISYGSWTSTRKRKKPIASLSRLKQWIYSPAHWGTTQTQPRDARKHYSTRLNGRSMFWFCTLSLSHKKGVAVIRRQKQHHFTSSWSIHL